MTRREVLRHLQKKLFGWPLPSTYREEVPEIQGWNWEARASEVTLERRDYSGFIEIITKADWAANQYCAEDSDAESALTQAMSMPSKYHVRIKGEWCDVYDVLLAFGVTNPADQHAIKKMLMPGKRGQKDGTQDRREAI